MKIIIFLFFTLLKIFLSGYFLLERDFLTRGFAFLWITIYDKWRGDLKVLLMNKFVKVLQD